MVPRTFRALSALVVMVSVGVSPSDSQAAITFTSGDFYTSDYFGRSITQYNQTGVAVGSLTLPAPVTDLRGLAFGPDSLLYATSVVSGGGFNVLALAASGAVVQTYGFGSAYLGGNISHGKIAVDAQNIFVAGGSLYRFEHGNRNSGTAIFTGADVYDVEILPTGNLLVATAYAIVEITRAGAVVRTVNTPSALLTDVRGVEFNPATNDIFATHLGHSNFYDRTMRFDGSTGTLERDTTFNYGDDLFLTSSGNLLVGSRTEAPRIFTHDLTEVVRFSGGSQMFVTQYVAAIPEPGTAFFALGLVGFCMSGRHRSSRRAAVDVTCA